MEIVLHPKFLKRYRKLPRNIRGKFVERKNLFVHEPHHPLLNNHSVGNAFLGCRSINVTGDYRAIFFSHSDETAVFVNIGTHSELYG